MDAVEKSVLNDFIGAMKDGQATEFRVVGNNLALIRHTFAELAPRLVGSNVLGLLGLVERPGVCYLQRCLELKYFPPFTPENSLLECFLLRWAGVNWSLTMFPRDYLGELVLDRAIAAAGLRATGTIPTAAFAHPHALEDGDLPADGQAAFACGMIAPDLPFRNILVLENVPGHLVYRDRAAAEKREEEMIAGVEAEWSARR